MIEIVWNWLAQNYPSVFAVLLAIVITWFVCWRYYKFEERLRKCEGHEEDLNQISTRIDDEIKSAKELERKVDSVQQDIAIIKTYLGVKDPKANSILTMKKSPLKLTETGQQVFEIVEGQQFIDENQDLLLKNIEEKQPRTALDVEITAKLVCMDLLNDPIFDRIKNIVYNHPALKIETENGETTDYTFSIADVCYVLSFPLRDLYLEKHPELVQND